MVVKSETNLQLFFLIRPTSRQKHSCALWSKCSLTPDLCFSHHRIRSLFVLRVSLLWASRGDGDSCAAVDALISKESLRLYFKGSAVLVIHTEADSLVRVSRQETQVVLVFLQQIPVWRRPPNSMFTWTLSELLDVTCTGHHCSADEMFTLWLLQGCCYVVVHKKGSI